MSQQRLGRKRKERRQPDLIQVWEVVLEARAECPVVLLGPELVIGVEVKQLLQVDSVRNVLSQECGWRRNCVEEALAPAPTPNTL